MAINLVSLVSQFLTPQLVGGLARALGITEAVAQKLSPQRSCNPPRRQKVRLRPALRKCPTPSPCRIRYFDEAQWRHQWRQTFGS